MAFAFVLLLFGMALLAAPVAYLWKGRRRMLAFAFLCAAMFVVAGLAYVLIALPDIAGVSEEKATLSLLDRHADEDVLQGWFRRTGADWHMGLVPETECASSCAQVMQVSFPHRIGLCETSGDRITMHFDDERQLEDWSVEPASNGC
jgi:hypothetical protein